MSERRLLAVSSVLAIVFFSLHVADDIARGFERGGPETMIGIAILTVWLYAALMLPGRRTGYAILLLGGLMASGVPALHLSGPGVGGAIARSPGGFLFIWTLFGLGVSGAFSLALAARGLWRLRRAPAPGG